MHDAGQGYALVAGVVTYRISVTEPLGNHSPVYWLDESWGALGLRQVCGVAVMMRPLVGDILY